MKSAILTTSAAALLTLFFTGSAAGQSASDHVSRASDAAPARENRSQSENDHFRSAMDHVFGPKGWRETSGYRSAARENQLRLQGAGTVPRGRLSRHSLGTPDAPGAYDAVVSGVSQARAAAVLRASGKGFTRVVAERAYGREGPHLHIEVGSAFDSSLAPEAAAASRADACNSIYLRVVGLRRNPQLNGC